MALEGIPAVGINKKESEFSCACTTPELHFHKHIGCQAKVPEKGTICEYCKTHQMFFGTSTD